MSSICTHSFEAGIALPLPALCVHTAENSPWNLSLSPNHQTCCPLNPLNLRHSLGKEETGDPCEEAADSVCISPSVCRAWPGHSLQDSFMNLSHLGEHVLSSRGAHLVLQWPQKSPWDKAHPDTSLGWDVLAAEMGKAQLSSFLEKTSQRGGIVIWSA